MMLCVTLLLHRSETIVPWTGELQAGFTVVLRGLTLKFKGGGVFFKQTV